MHVELKETVYIIKLFLVLEAIYRSEFYWKNVDNCGTNVS